MFLVKFIVDFEVTLFSPQTYKVLTKLKTMFKKNVKNYLIK